MEHFRKSHHDHNLVQLPPPHLPFDIPLVPMDRRVLDPADNHPLKGRVRLLPENLYAEEAFMYDDDADDEGYETTPNVSSMSKRGAMPNIYQETQRGLGSKKSLNSKRLNKLATYPGAAPVTFDEKVESSPAFHFPRSEIQISQRRLKRAAALSNNKGNSDTPAEIPVPPIEIEFHDSQIYEEDESQFSRRRLPYNSSKVSLSSRSSVQTSPRSSAVHLPMIDPNKFGSLKPGESMGNLSRSQSSQRLTSRSRISIIQAQMSARNFIPAKEFCQPEENGELYLHKISHIKDDPLTRLTRRSEMEGVVSPLVANWKQEFANKKDTLNKKLKSQLEERNEDRIVGRNSRRILSKAYEGAIADASSVYHDGMPKKTLIWQRARNQIILESPDSRRVMAFTRELQHFREEARRGILETPSIRHVFSAIKMYLEEFRPLDENLLVYLIKSYALQAQTNREIYNILNFVRERLGVPWMDFVEMLTLQVQNEEEASNVTATQQGGTKLPPIRV